MKLKLYVLIPFFSRSRHTFPTFPFVEKITKINVINPTTINVLIPGEFLGFYSHQRHNSFNCSIYLLVGISGIAFKSCERDYIRLGCYRYNKNSATPHVKLLNDKHNIDFDEIAAFMHRFAYHLQFSPNLLLCSGLFFRPRFHIFGTPLVHRFTL